MFVLLTTAIVFCVCVCSLTTASLLCSFTAVVFCVCVCSLTTAIVLYSVCLFFYYCYTV